MESAIVGLPFSGKTTLFNLLTGAHATTGAFAGAEAAANVGVAKVPDERLDHLAALYRPKRTTHAEVRYLDLGLTKGAGRGEGMAGRHLAELRDADALVHVVRAFSGPSVPHVEGSVDPSRDATALELELLVADLGVIERREQRLEPELRAARASERDEKERAKALLGRVRAALAAGTAVRDLDLDQDERKQLRGFRLLTEKPQLVLVNVDEADLARADAMASEVAAGLGATSRLRALPLSVKIEAETAELPAEEAAAFRRELGLSGAPPLERVIRETYDLLGLLSFFTVSQEECRAWTVARGTTAVEAAGVIHSDLARGFIRAEVLRWDELLTHGGLPEARAKGALRMEGKDYVVRDGEVFHVLFNV